MSIHLADSHAHLDLEDHFPDQAAVLQRARQAGVDLVINVATGLRDAPQVIATAKKSPGIVAIIGVHPHGAGTMTEGDLEAMDSLAADSKVVAIGEIGLDFYRRRSPEETQQYWFRRQLEFAIAHKKVVVIHTREATPVTLSILREYRGRLAGGVMHCYGGSLEEAHSFLDLGFYLSFSGTLTYPKAGPLREVARQVPLGRILVETDCPYLPPQPWRGKRNEPAYVVATAQQLADARGLALEEVAAHTWANTLAVFGLKETEVLRK
ncbi:MAG: TatD family hydrolase [Thermodesulfobacteriota bacterium]